MSPEIDTSHEQDPIKRIYRWKEASSVEINAMSTEQLKAFISDLNGKINVIYDVIMFPVDNDRAPTAEEVDQMLNPHKLAGHEEVDRFVESQPEAPQE